MRLSHRIALFALGSVAIATMARGLVLPQQTEVERGKYLVEEVAKCSECHTPRDRNNQLDPQRWLQGAPIWITPVRRTDNWANSAPSIAGLSSYTDEQMERVLEKGEGAGQTPIQPPMHIYHMNHSDATAIIAYLRSLPGNPLVHP